MTRLAIFDFDGTLADTTDAIVGTMQATLDNLGISPVEAGRTKELIGLPLIECVRTITGYSDPADVQRATDLYRSLWPRFNAADTRLFPGVYDTLHRLHDTGIIMAVATSRSRVSVLQMLDTLGLTPFIATVRADEDVAHKKPAPDMVLSILDELHIAAHDAVTVGDTTFDIGMGASAGTLTVGVSYGNHTATRLATARPDHIIDDFTLLPSCLKC